MHRMTKLRNNLTPYRSTEQRHHKPQRLIDFLLPKVHLSDKLPEIGRKVHLHLCRTVRPADGEFTVIHGGDTLVSITPHSHGVVNVNKPTLQHAKSVYSYVVATQTV